VRTCEYDSAGYLFLLLSPASAILLRLPYDLSAPLFLTPASCLSNEPAEFRVTPGDWPASRGLVRSYIAAGATHLILNLRPPYPDRIARSLVMEIVEPLLS
jgi:hypothetical protein